MRQKTGRNDSVFVFYAGHGQTDEVTKSGSWIPVDGGRDQYAQANWLPNIQIRNMLEALPALHVFLIADACFSGDILDTNRGASPEISSEYLRRAYSLVSRQVMTSGASESVPDSSEFAMRLKSALSRTNEPCIDPERLFMSVREVRATRPILGYIKESEHQKGGSFLFFRRPDQTVTAQNQSAPIIPRNIRNNFYFLESVRLGKLAQEAYDLQNYDLSAKYSTEANQYARLSDEYIRNQFPAASGPIQPASVHTGSIQVSSAAAGTIIVGGRDTGISVKEEGSVLITNVGTGRTTVAVRTDSGLIQGEPQIVEAGQTVRVRIEPLVTNADFTIEGTTLVKYTGTSETPVIPWGITEIGFAVFAESKITSVDIPASVTAIGNWAFFGSELSSVNIPAGVTTIGEAVFGRSQLISVNIPSSVTTIGDEAFSDCENLTTVELSRRTAIGDNAFEGSPLVQLRYRD